MSAKQGNRNIYLLFVANRAIAGGFPKLNSEGVFEADK